MIRYILLAFAWLLVLASIVYFWAKYDAQPPVALWVIFAILTLIPFADILKIGNWFEFRRKSNKNDKVTSNIQDKIINIANLNVQITSEDAAQAFTKSLFPESKEELTEENKHLIEFIYNADQAIASIVPLLQIWYGFVEIKVKNRPATPKQLAKATHADNLSLVKTVKEHAPKILGNKNINTKFQDLLESVERLIILRKAIDDSTTSPPPVEEAKKIVLDVYQASNYLAGMTSAAVAVLFPLSPK